MCVVSSTAFANGRQIKGATRRVDGEPRRVAPVPRDSAGKWPLFCTCLTFEWTHLSAGDEGPPLLLQCLIDMISLINCIYQTVYYYE